MIGKKYGELCQVNIVSLDSYTNEIPTGKIYNTLAPNGIPFRGLMQFFREMDQTMDAMDNNRIFTSTHEYESPPAELLTIPNQNGKLATFAVRVLFRQNASWQGCFTWLEGKQEKSFRSALELTMAMSHILISQ